MALRRRHDEIGGADPASANRTARPVVRGPRILPDAARTGPCARAAAASASVIGVASSLAAGDTRTRSRTGWTSVTSRRRCVRRRHGCSIAADDRLAASRKGKRLIRRVRAVVDDSRPSASGPSAPGVGRDPRRHAAAHGNPAAAPLCYPVYPQGSARRIPARTNRLPITPAPHDQRRLTSHRNHLATTALMVSSALDFHERSQAAQCKSPARCVLLSPITRFCADHRRMTDATAATPRGTSGHNRAYGLDHGRRSGRGPRLPGTTARRPALSLRDHKPDPRHGLVARNCYFYQPHKGADPG